MDSYPSDDGSRHLVTRTVDPVVRPFRVLSLGAGVQSSAVAMMMKHGEIEKADMVVFADTGCEPKAVYVWLDWLVANMDMPFQHVMTGEGLTKAIESACKTGTRVSSVPLFTENRGRLRRQCTWDYKVVPIRRAVRELIGKKRKCTMVRGVSSEEAHRAKPSDVKWATHEHPLVDLGMSRTDCKRWMVKHSYPIPPRSACVYCPNRCNVEWQKMRDLAPDDWAEACRMDALMRDSLPGLREKCFVHRQLVPLAEADLRGDVDRGQLLLNGDGFVDCEGMWGV